MKKYIGIDKVIEAAKDGLLGYRRFNELIKEAEPMVSVKSLQDIVTSYARKDINYSKLIDKIRVLTTKEPKLYAGLTVEDWEKLNKLPYVLIELHDTMGDETECFLDDFMRKGGEIEYIKELLPDQKNHVRAHISYDPPVPNNVLVETYYPGIAVGNDCKACYKNWGSSDHLGRKVTGYRIVGVSNEWI